MPLYIVMAIICTIINCRYYILSYCLGKLVNWKPFVENLYFNKIRGDSGMKNLNRRNV